jgi:thioredoxin 1
LYFCPPSKEKKKNIMAKEFTDGNFQNEVLSADKLTVVDFWAEWCGPCRAIGPVIESLAKEYDGKINVGKVNVDVNPAVSMNYGITSIPAILFFKNGQVVDKLVGAQPKGNFVKKIESHI